MSYILIVRLTHWVCIIEKEMFWSMFQVSPSSRSGHTVITKNSDRDVDSFLQSTAVNHTKGYRGGEWANEETVLGVYWLND